MGEEIAWLVLRICFGAMFLLPVRDLIVDFDAATELTKILIPYQPRFFAVVMIAVMVLGAISILFGIYAQIAGFFLLIYCLLGIVVHYRTAAYIATRKLSNESSRADRACSFEAVSLGVAGNETAGQKNMVLAAVACFFMILGSGPLSLTGNLF